MEGYLLPHSPWGTELVTVRPLPQAWLEAATGPGCLVHPHPFLSFENFIIDGETAQNLLVGLWETG